MTPRVPRRRPTPTTTGSPDLLPAPGALTTWVPPMGPGVRVDTGFVQGDVIGGNFDSLLAKLIVHAETRAEAIAGLVAALAVAVTARRR